MTAALRVLPLLALLAQAEDFQKRVRIDGQKVFVDDTLLYEGPWQKADVSVVDFTGKKARATFGPYLVWKQVVLTVDGEEKLRLPVPSLRKPIAWPPLRLEEVKPLLKKLTETQDGKKTFVVLLSTEKGDAEIYRGPVYEARVERTVGAFSVLLNEEVLYRVTRSSKPSARGEDVATALNAYRLRAGLEVARLSPALSKGCDLHALYLAKNEFRGLSGHDEDPKGTGYTEEGARAGKRSVISPFNPHESPVDALDSLMATLYHRVSLLQPGLSEVGVGWAYRKDGLGYLVVDVGSLEARVDPKVYPIVYPVDGQREVPREFGLGSRETPNPVPEEGAAPGYPVTVQLPERRPADPELRLYQGGQEVSCWLSTPERPARKDWPQAGVACLIPKEKLKAEATYTVRFQDRALRKEWSFTTGR
jgi:uncharacterized protein YkwD